MYFKYYIKKILNKKHTLIYICSNFIHDDHYYRE